MNLSACSAYQHYNLTDSQNLFHLKNILKDVTINSHFDRRIQKCCFQEGRNGISRYFNTNKTLATFGQSGH